MKIHQSGMLNKNNFVQDGINFHLGFRLHFKVMITVLLGKEDQILSHTI
jgi:alpha-glucosidase (family GH31 glycosyl hydrolase)